MHSALTAPLRIAQRLLLAVKFYSRLGYSWHLAWTKAAR
jgi:hypothetical protein